MAAALGCGGGGEPSAPAVVAQVIVSPATQTLASGATFTLVATPQDAAGKPLSGRVITWATGDPARATVTANGVVTAGLVVEGTAQPVEIRASSEGRTGVATLTVLPVAVGRVVLTPDAAQLMAGAATQFSVAVLGADGTPLTGRDIQWSTSDAAIATVSAPGAVTTVPYVGGLVRLVKVIVRSEGVADTAEVTVTPVPVATVTVTPGGGAVVEGDTLQLAVTTADSTGRTLTGRAVTFATSDPAVATVSATGRVIATPYTGNLLSRPVTISAASEGQATNVPLQVTVDLNRASTFYERVPNGFPSLAAHYAATGLALSTGTVIADLNKDGRGDLVVHLWHGRSAVENLTLSPMAPTPNRLVALVANPDGTYADKTLELFGSAAVDLNGSASRNVRMADVNGDGYPDWFYATNKEDFRPPVGTGCIGPCSWATQAAGVLSNGDGTYRVVTFGVTKYHHAVAVLKSPAGPWHVLFNGNDFNDPASYQVDGGGFTFFPGYPPRAIGTIASYSSTGAATSDRLIVESGDAPSTMLQYSLSGAVWTQTARFDWETTRPVDLVATDGSVESTFLRTHTGGEYIGHGGFFESCIWRPGAGQPPMVVAMLQTLVVPGGTQGRAAVPRSEAVGWNRLFLLRVSGNRLEDAGTISDREGRFGINFIFCNDINGDGLDDLATHPYRVGAKPRVFLNDGSGRLSLVPEARFPLGPQGAAWTSLLVDSNGDGIKDLVYFEGNGCAGGAQCATFHLYRGRRHLR